MVAAAGPGALCRGRGEHLGAGSGEQLRAGAAAARGGAGRLSRRVVGAGPVAGRGPDGTDAAGGPARIGAVVPRVPRAEHARLRPGGRARAVAAATAVRRSHLVVAE